jgi:AraC-like DNA-binding protein
VADPLGGHSGYGWRAAEPQRCWDQAPGTDGVRMLDVVRTLTLAFDGYHFPRHAHEHWSIAVIDGGGGSFRCSGAGHRFGSGSVTVLHPAEAHDGAAGPAGIRYRSLAVPEAVIKDVLGTAETPSFVDRVLQDDTAHTLLGRAHCALAGNHPDPWVLVDALDHLFGAYASGGRGRASDGHASVMEAVGRYVDKRLNSPITLAALAAHLDLSPAVLLRRFRAEAGMAPYEYVVSRRVDVAQGLLARGVPIADVAVRAGFADQSHLTRHFKRVVGITPGNYLRRPAESRSFKTG